MYKEIYEPSPLAVQSNQPAFNTDISKALNEYGNYFELIKLYYNSNPYMYDKIGDVSAHVFLYNSMNALLSKKHEQELINKSQQKN